MAQTKSLYLTKVQLKAELDRCLNCANKPCMNACPVNCSPQEFISHAKNGDFEQAVATITRNNPMGQTCGLICPDKFCMKACTRSRIDFAVNIPKVQATILENYRNPSAEAKAIRPNGRKVAVIGAGPAGLAAAAELGKQGYYVCLYEASDKIGGALNMIPDERLPYEVIAKDWSFIFNRDFITLYLTTKIGSPSDLFSQGFDGVIVATGEPNVTDLGIPGQEYAVSYMEYLHHPSKYETKGRVAVIGGGNVAADCAFTAAANGAAQVEMFVRRRLADMRISQLEYLELLKREIDIMSMSSPEKIEKTADGYSLYIRKNRLTDGHWQPLANSTVELPGFSLIVTAIGSRADPKVNDERIIYAGDCKHGGSTIVEAFASGRDAARLMESRLVMAAE